MSRFKREAQENRRRAYRSRLADVDAYLWVALPSGPHQVELIDISAG
ncbi:MAG: hypothetical protein AAGG01_13185 [Planctomycetota bacterium]